MRTGPGRRAAKEKRRENGTTTQMAPMAGILFTATSLLLGIATFVSPARIYPPNEGKGLGGGNNWLDF